MVSKEIPKSDLGGGRKGPVFFKSEVGRHFIFFTRNSFFYGDNPGMQIHFFRFLFRTECSTLKKILFYQKIIKLARCEIKFNV